MNARSIFLQSIDKPNLAPHTVYVWLRTISKVTVERHSLPLKPEINLEDEDVMAVLSRRAPFPGITP
jgi:hypothetical protein